MKKKILLTTVIVAFISAMAFSQPGMGKRMGKNPQATEWNECKGHGFEKIPNLTDEQKSKIEKIRTAHMKVITEKQALLKEKRAHLKTLMVNDNPDQKEIDKTIDEIDNLRGDLMKERVKTQLEIKALLTDEQKAYFNKRIISGEKHKGMHKKHMYKG